MQNQAMRCVIGLLTFGFLTTAAAQVAAQPTITSPTVNQVFRAGPDYATDELNDPWDFSNNEDLALDPQEFGGWATSPVNRWYSIGTGATFITGGAFQGTGNGDNQLMLLHRGDGIGLNPGRNGIRHPIRTALYKKFAMKVTYTNAMGGTFGSPAVYWFHTSYALSNFLNRAGGALFSIIPEGDSTQVHTLDLSQAGAAGTGSQLVPACGGGGPCTGVPAPWTAEAEVRGFRIDPTTQFSTVGVSIDWVRLTAADNSPQAALMNVTFNNCTGSSSIGVRDAAGAVTPVVSGGATTGASFNYGIFPPGTYTLVLTCNNGSSERAFSINSPPHVTVLDPDETGDASTDYAFTSSGGTNRWDMEQTGDIAITTNVTTTAGACAGTPCGLVTSDLPGAPVGSLMFRASSSGTTPSELGDPALDFLGGTTNLLSSLRHRYLTFSMRLNRPYDLAVGSVARFLWGSQNFTNQSNTTTSQDMRVWPGFQTYTIDLGALSLANGGIEDECLALSPPCLTTPWGTRSLRFFRIDPHEFGDAPTLFDIDNVSLTAPDEVNLSGTGAGSSFTVRWNLADSDSTGATYATRVFIDGDRDPSSGRVQITNPASPITTGPGAGQFVWIPPDTLATGNYFVYVETTETRGGITQVQGAYSTGPVLVYSATASSPQVSLLTPAPNTTVPFPFTITGCAFDQGNTSGINMDDLSVIAIAGVGVTNTPPGTAYSLGAGSGFGTLQYGPLTPSTPVVCPTITNTSSPFRNAGYRVVDVGLQPGPWTLRALGRSTISGQLTPIGVDVPITVTQTTFAPTNFQVTATGNTVTVSFGPPNGGPPVTSYAVDGALNANFSPLSFSVPLPSPGTYSGSLPNGTFFLRVSGFVGGARQTPSETRSVTLPAGGPQPPGAPALTATQVASNPIVLSWAAGTGGAPTNFTLNAGTSAGASDLASVPMGLANTISATAPIGVRIFVRVVAQNSAGQATSNEINFQLASPSAPGPPTLNPSQVSNRNVTLSWAAPTTGGAPSSYTVLARLSPTGAIVASLPGQSGSTVTVPAPPGTYFVSLMAVNGAGNSAESNQITVVVP